MDEAHRQQLAVGTILGEACRWELSEGGLFVRGKEPLSRETVKRLLELFSDSPTRIFGMRGVPEARGDHRSDPRGLGAWGEADPAVFNIADRKAEEPGGGCLTGAVLSRLLAGHRENRSGLLRDVAAARFLSDRGDMDVFFAHFLALEATKSLYLEEIGPLLERAAVQVREGKRGDGDPALSRLVWGALALERRLETGSVTFAKVLDPWLGALAYWALGKSDHKLDPIFEKMALEAQMLDHAELLALESFDSAKNLPAFEGSDIRPALPAPAVGERAMCRWQSLNG